MGFITLARHHSLRLAAAMAVSLALATVAFTATSQLAAGPARETVRVRPVKLLEGEPVGLRFHLGWLGSGFFHCQTASSMHQATATMEVWQEGKLVASDRPNGYWGVRPDAKPFDIRTSITVTEHPGNVLMLRSLVSSESGDTCTPGYLEVTTPKEVTLHAGYFINSISEEVVLAPGEEKVVWAMKWMVGLSDRSLTKGEDGTLDVTDADKGRFLILLKIGLEPWHHE